MTVAGRETGMDECDVVVAGAGAGGMTAAAVAAAEGARVVLLDKASTVGGTTAVSGGMVWLAGNRKMAEAGPPASLHPARTYLGAVLPAAVRTPLLEAFLTRGDEALGYLEARTAVRMRPVRTYPDYFPDLPGATAGGRVLEPEPFDARVLGSAFALLAPPLPEFTLFGGMMIDRADIPHFRRAARSPRSALRVARLLARYGAERLRAPRGTTLVLGNALAGRLLKSVLDLGVDLRLSTALAGLLVEDGRVAGVRVRTGGRDSVIRARAVVVATGGWSHDAARRVALLPATVAGESPTAAVATGDGIAAALAAGGAFHEGADQNAFWSPVSAFRRADGAAAVFPHTVTDRGKPGFLMVDPTGRRFVSEARSYHAVGSALIASGHDHCFLISDRTALWRYGIGALKPFAPPWTVRAAVARGNVVQADDLAGLGRAIGVDPDALEATVARFNGFAADGIDRDFGRGGDAYQRHMGDVDNRPNPSLGALATPPFHAIRITVSDLGTAAGLSTDASGRVLDAAGAPVAGLFACGNDMASVMEGAYPGPGITLGPALVFGYLAGRAVAAEAR